MSVIASLTDLVQSHTGALASALCALLWAVAVILFRKGVRVASPVAINLFKTAVATGAVALTLLTFGLPFVPPEATLSHLLILLASGALGIGVADSLFLASLHRLGAGRSAIVDSLYSPFVVAMGALWLGEPVGPFLLAAVAMMVVAILIGAWQPEELGSREDMRRITVGVVLGILAMLGMAVGIVMAKPVLNVTDAWWATGVRLAGGLLFLLVHGAFPAHRRAVVACFTPGPHWRVLLPASLIGTYMAMFFWILGMKHTWTTVASVLNQTSVLWVLLLAAPFLGERLNPRKTLAVLLGFAGAVLATWG